MIEIAGGIILAVFFFFALFVIFGIISEFIDNFRMNARWRQAREEHQRKVHEATIAREARCIAVRQSMDRLSPDWDKGAQIDDVIIQSVDFHFVEQIGSLEKWDGDWVGNWSGIYENRKIAFGFPFWPEDDSAGADWHGIQDEANRAKDILMTAGFEPERAVDLINFANFCMILADDEEERTAVALVARSKVIDAYIRALRAGAFMLEQTPSVPWLNPSSIR